MKIDRLIGILALLLQQERVTAPQLARTFEVSRRTIQRDVEALCRAGIPLVTTHGQGGGISIMEGYRIDSTLLTSGDMQAILAGLRSLDSVSGTNRYAQLMEKLSPGASTLMPGSQNLLIDLSSWYRDSLAPKIERIRQAMDTSREIAFCYYAPGGNSRRRVEPYYLVFHWSSWYVWGYCVLRQDYRLFKLNRMTELALGEPFVRRAAPLPDLSDQRVFPGGIQVKALFDPSCKWRLVEEFGEGCYEEQPDGRLLFQWEYTYRDNLLAWLMTFRDQVTLLEPAATRQEIIDACRRMLRAYEAMEHGTDI